MAGERPAYVSRLVGCIDAFGRQMDHMTHRHWLLTWRTYGTWLPGDGRGFVDPVVTPAGRRVINNTPGVPMDADNPRLRNYARSVMKAEPLRLDPGQAAGLFAQFRETAGYRGWDLLAVAVLTNHIHLVVRVTGDPDGADILRDFKSYGGRRLNRGWGVPANGSWWSESGSRRALRGDANVRAAVEYVAGQAGAWVIWVGSLPAG